MATKFYKFKGKAAWAKVVVPDESEYGVNWTIDMYLDKDNWALLKSSGVRLGEIKNPVFQGENGVKFKRPTEKVIKGDMAKFDPPKVTGPDDKPFDELIGNGSIVEVVVAVYETRAGKGHRLESVKVLEHTPYVSNREVISVDNAEEVLGGAVQEAKATSKKVGW